MFKFFFTVDIECLIMVSYLLISIDDESFEKPIVVSVKNRELIALINRFSVVSGGQQKYTFLFDGQTPVENRCFSGREKSCDVRAILTVEKRKCTFFVLPISTSTVT